MNLHQPAKMETIGRYRIIEALPRTGIATVYKAFDQEFDGYVFVKRYPEGYIVDPTARARYEREMQLLSLLENPTVVPIYEIDEQDGSFYIVTPYLTGGSLAEKLFKGPLPVDEILMIFEKLVFCLEAVHELGIYHQAIKPTNIIFDDQGEPYISDFGTSKLAECSPSGTAVISEILVSPLYMSPEQVKGQEISDNKSDIYALGILLYEMLVGQPPFEASSFLELAIQQVEAAIPNIQTDQLEYPPGCEILMQYSLAKNPDDRFTSLWQMNEVLKSVFAGEDTVSIQAGLAVDDEVKVSPTPVDENYFETKQRPTRLKVFWGAASVIILLGVIIFLLWGNKLPPKLISQFGLNNASFTPELSSEKQIFPDASSTSTPDPATATASPVVVNIVDQITTREETPTPTLTPTSAPTLPVLTIGGADKIAFINDHDIWMANIDGSSLERLTYDEQEKTGLRWSQDGLNLTYLVEGRERELQVFSEPSYGFGVKSYVEEGSLVTYSSQQNKKAKIVEESWNGRQVEVIKVFDLKNKILDVFPGGRFDMRGYSGANDAPVIMEYAWDGADLFALHGDVLRDGGDLIIYNMGTANAQITNPINGSCCYKDLAWSPDGQYLLFAYQDVRYDDAPKLYYVPYGTIGTGQTYEPIDLPYYFFADSKARIYPALHPAGSSFPTQTPTLAPTPTQTPRPTVDVDKAYGNATVDPDSETMSSGGADKIAFLRNNDIWTVNIDGSGLQLIQKMGVSITDLQWSGDGQSIIYKSGSCYEAVSLQTKETISLGCYITLNTSPDGELAAVSTYLKFGDNLERLRASVLPFDLAQFSRIKQFLDLETLGSCPLVEGEFYRWSNDKQQIAVVVETIENGRKAQAVRIFNLGDCGVEADMIDTFPAPRFTMRGYSEEDSTPVIADFSWDGERRFAISSYVQDGFGDFIVYDMDTRKAEILDPLKKSCCYRDIRWSPDGDYLFYSTQDVQEGMLVYYATYDQIKDQGDLAPIPFPAGFWDGVDLSHRLFPALRPGMADREQPAIPVQMVKSDAADIKFNQIGSLSQSGSVYDLDISPDGARLAVGAGNLLTIWDLASQKMAHVFDLALNKHTEAITGTKFAPDGQYLASCSADESVRVWKLDYFAPKFNMNEHAMPVLTLKYSPDGNALATGSADGDIILWRTSNGGIYRKLIGHVMPVYEVAYTPDGQKLISGSADKTVRVWEVNTGNVLHILEGHHAPVSGVAVSPDGRYAASSSWDGTVRVWNIETGDLLHILKSSEAPVSAVLFSPAGGILLAGSEDGSISVWETASFELVEIIDDQDSAVLSFSFSPDGKTLAAGYDDGKVILWEIAP